MHQSGLKSKVEAITTTLLPVTPRGRRGRASGFQLIFGAIQVEPLWPERLVVSFQTKRDMGVYAMRGGSRSTSGTCLLISHDSASEPEKV